MCGALRDTYSARVLTVEKLSDDSSIIYFSVKGKTFAYEPGQYITVFFEGSSQVAGKAYSLASIPSEARCSIVVKDIGEFSGRLCALRKGDTFTCSSGYGHLNPFSEKPLVCITGGIGLAPIWSIAKSELEKDSSHTVTIVCSHRSSDVIPFLSELRSAEKTYANFLVRAHITKQKSVPSDMQKGRVSIVECLAHEHTSPMYLLCGSIGFVRDMWRGLSDAGVSPDRISAESFFE